jgi:hypothetical protein
MQKTETITTKIDEENYLPIATVTTNDDGTVTINQNRPLATGRAAQLQLGSLMRNFARGGAEALGDNPLPVAGRAERRAADRRFARMQRKGVRKYVAQQMAQLDPPTETNSQQVKRLRAEKAAASKTPLVD